MSIRFILYFSKAECSLAVESLERGRKRLDKRFVDGVYCIKFSGREMTVSEGKSKRK